MKTPVVVVAGQEGTDAIVQVMLRTPGSVAVRHHFTGHVVLRTVVSRQHGLLITAEVPLELSHGCVSCTIRNDLLLMLRRLHRRDDVRRVVVHLEPWLEPEPICWAVNHIRVRMGPGYADGPAALDVSIAAVVTCIDSSVWLRQALGDAELDDGRTEAQVVVGQAEFADVAVLTPADPVVASVVRRLAPRAQIGVDSADIERILADLRPDARLGRSDDPHGPLLAGQPPLETQGAVKLLEFGAQRPFHPQRLEAAIDTLLDGVIRARGRLWLASQPEKAMWVESAGGGLHVSSAGKWLAAMTEAELAGTNAERRAFGQLRWRGAQGDRHTAMTVLAYGTSTDGIVDALRGALLTDAEFHCPQEWALYHDPFGDWHQETYDSPVEATTDTRGHHNDPRDC